MNDKPKTTEKKKNEKKSEAASRRPLLRSSKDDRVLWGVAGGLAEHINVDPILVRVGFVVSIFFGGAGVLAYLALAIGIPEDDGTGNPTDERARERITRVLLVCLLAVAVLAGGFGFATVSLWSAATGHGIVIAAIVIALGVTLVVTAFTSSSRRLAPWLLALALVLAVPAGAVAAAGIHFDESVGQREYRPAAFADLPGDGYELGSGQLVVDLRDLPWSEGRDISLSSDLGAGQMIVSVPPGVCVDADATAKAGELLVRGDQSDGVDPEIDQPEPQGSGPRLRLDAEIQFGQLIVTDEDPDHIDDYGVDYDRNQFERDEARMACGT
jgi:phage shock protein PspC (stress-responsive transcriptional regulator)